MADDKRKKDETPGMPRRTLPSATPPTAAGYQTGTAVRRAIGRAAGAVGEVGRRGLMGAVRASAPVVKPIADTVGFARGLAGASAPTPINAPAPAAAAAPAPNRQPTTAVAPQRPMAAQPSPAAAAPSQQMQQPAVASSPVVGSFNGRDLTRADTDRLAGSLPTAAGPVSTGAGGFAFTPAGGEGATSARVDFPDTPQPTAAPTVTVPRTLRGDLRGAEDERSKAAEGIDRKLRYMAASPAGLNSRGERQLYAELLGQRSELTGQRVNQATALETQGAELEAGAATESARLAGRAIESNADRALQARNFASQDADRDAALEQQRRGVSQVLVRDDGSTNVLRADGTLAPVTGADGQPFRQLQDPKREGQVSPDTEYKALSDRMTQLQAFGRPEGAEAAGYDQEIAQLRARMAQLSGGGQKTVKRTGTLDGRRVVEYSDGTTEFLD